MPTYVYHNTLRFLIDKMIYDEKICQDFEITDQNEDDFNCSSAKMIWKTQSKVSHSVMLRLVLKMIFLNFAYLIFFGKTSNLYFYLPKAVVNSMDQKQKVGSYV